MEANAAIYFNPDGYVSSGRNVLGRHVAGESFLRAAVEARSGRDLWGFVPRREWVETYAALVKAFDPSATTPPAFPADQSDRDLGRYAPISVART